MLPSKVDGLSLILQRTKTNHIFEVCVFNRPNILSGQSTVASFQIKPSLPQDTFPAEPSLRCSSSNAPRHRTFQEWNVKPHTLRSFLVPTRKSSTLDGSFSFMASSSHCLMEWRGKGGRRETGQVHVSCRTAHENKMQEIKCISRRKKKKKKSCDSPGMSQRWHIRQVKHNYDS